MDLTTGRQIMSPGLHLCWMAIGAERLEEPQIYLFAVSTSEAHPQGLLNFFQPAGAYAPERAVTATILFGLLFIGLVYERMRTQKLGFQQV